jgi:hypothetical protein
LKGTDVNMAGADAENILRRLSEVLDVLKRISDDLQEISDSLKAAAPAKAPKTMTLAPPGPERPSPKTEDRRIEDIRMMFTKELEDMLVFEDRSDHIKITPRQYLGSENFAKIAAAIREAGGEYVSAGKASHFRVPK